MSIVTHSGIITTIAGNGEPALAGDGQLAIEASLNEPKGLTLDELGNVFIADSENHVIRKLDRKTGRIVTVAGGSEMPTATDEATHIPAGQVEDPLSDRSTGTAGAFSQQTDLSGTVRYVVPVAGVTKRYSGDGGPARTALLNFPTAVAVDGKGDLYIADTMNHRVRRVDARTGLISTIAGTGQPRFGGDGGPSTAAGLNEPAALAVRGTWLYIADQSNHRVRAIDLLTGVIHTVAGTGAAAYNGDGIPATDASLAGPSGLAVGADGTLYVADTFNGRIRAVDAITGSISTVVGDGQEYRYQGDDESASKSVSRPSGLAVDAQGNLFLTDSDNHLVRRWDRTTGVLHRLAGVGTATYGGDGESASEAGLSYPFGIIVAPDGHLLIADTFNHRVRNIVLQ